MPTVCTVRQSGSNSSLAAVAAAAAAAAAAVVLVGVVVGVGVLRSRRDMMRTLLLVAGGAVEY